jgi:1-aminocyclopropane-1-carboxylate deaminase/D-cysteine desulfhydrase-like pyridoxal-dependent ACC family enzyme
MTQRELFRHFPHLDVPWKPLATVPTPVHRLEKLGAAWGHHDLWIKRDDLASPLYGGNKVRKLEFILAEMERSGARDFIVYGGVGSNQVIATVLFGEREGYRGHALLFHQPRLAIVDRNFAVDVRLGTRCHYLGSPLKLPWYLFREYRRLKRETGVAPYIVPPGGSSPLSTLGYVDAGLELAAQVKAGALPEPEVLVAPLGSTGTCAGLLVSLALSGLRTKLVAVRVVDRAVCNRWTLAWQANATLNLIARHGGEVPPYRFRARSLDVRHEYFGRCYGGPTPEGLAVLREMQETEGFTLETTYTAKALAAVRDLCREKAVSGPVLFWNTCNCLDLGEQARLPLAPGEIPKDFAAYFAERSADA